jgi:hypothetical protein
VRDPEGIGSLVGRVARDLGLAEVVATGRLFRNWEEIVGPQVAARSQPLSLRSGVLRIQTDSAAWAAEVRYLAPEVLRRANAALGGEVARQLEVALKPGGRDRGGPERKRRTTTGGERETEGKRAVPPGTGPESGAPLPIKDPDLADAVARVLDASRSARRDIKGRKGPR